MINFSDNGLSLKKRWILLCCSIFSILVTHFMGYFPYGKTFANEFAIIGI